MEGDQILDKIIVTGETFHSLKATKTHGILLKLDI